MVSLVFPPDPASVGQHMADVAREMASRGWEVVVHTANRGYEDSSNVFPLREHGDGIDIRRVRWSSFGKKSVAHRIGGQLSFCAQVFFRLLFVSHLDGLLITTIPTFSGALGWVIRLFRRTHVTFWLMDLNPDQAVAMGEFRQNSPIVRIFDWFNRRILKVADVVVTMDRFMATKLESKYELGNKLAVLPPWPHEDSLETVSADDNPFLIEHGLMGKFVLMYSGNHSLVHPLDTVVKAALRVEEKGPIEFLFVGGGTGKRIVDETIRRENPKHIRSLPYEPFERIKYSLSAADVHLVTMGDSMVGCVHPCKIYGAMALSRPILFVGPQHSHAGEILERFKIGWHVEQGDIDGMERTLHTIVNTPREVLRALGICAREAVDREFSKTILCGQFCDLIEGKASPL